MKSKKKMIIGGIIIVCIAVLAIVLWQNNQSKDDVNPDENVSEQADDKQNETNENGESGDSTQDTDETGSQDNADNNTDEKETNNGDSTGISFPYTIPNTNLVVQKFSDYDGIYFEDGSDAEIENVSAILVTNTGSKPIEYAEVTIKNGTKEMLFKISTLPAGESAVVQEANQVKYEVNGSVSFQAECAEVDSFEMSEGKVKIEETESGNLIITNLTDEYIPCVRVFYKFYMEEEEVFVGGITYVSKVTGLGAKSSQTITPKHYAAGSSKIVMIRTYKTAE